MKKKFTAPTYPSLMGFWGWELAENFWTAIPSPKDASGGRVSGQQPPAGREGVRNQVKEKKFAALTKGGAGLELTYRRERERERPNPVSPRKEVAIN